MPVRSVKEEIYEKDTILWSRMYYTLFLCVMQQKSIVLNCWL